MSTVSAVAIRAADGRGGTTQMRERCSARIRIARVVTRDHPLHVQRLVDRCGQRPRSYRASGRRARVPRADTLPRVGFSPTMLPNAAGTRPDPAVSVPSANGTMPAATAQAEPDDEPPGTCVRHRTHCAARRTGCACRRGRWRTDRGWSCRSAARLHPADAARQARSPSPYRQSPGRRRWSAGRRRRCCPSPRTARPRTCGRADLPPPVARAGQHFVVGQTRDPDRWVVVIAVGGERGVGGFDGCHAAAPQPILALSVIRPVLPPASRRPATRPRRDSG